MTDYREILRLHHLGVSVRTIAVSVGISRNTVSRFLKSAAEEKIQWPLTEEMSNQKIREKVFPSHYCSSLYKMPDFDHIHTELAKSGVTLTLLWQEYSESCQSTGCIPYKYSQFSQLYHDYALKTKATMRIQHKPGEKLEVDWAGQTASVRDNISGRPIKAYIFVAVLPYSGYTYSAAFPNMNMVSWIRGHLNCFDYLGGITRILVPDNLKTGVTYVSWFDSVINSTYNEMATHYDTVVIPARVRKPKDKASVEGGVGVISTWLIAATRNQSFFSFPELNAALREKLRELNTKPFQKKEGCRESVFLEEEKHLLIPLPPQPYDLARWSKATVQFNSHVYYDKMYYSVPYEDIKPAVHVKATHEQIEIFYRSNRIACHPKKYGAPGQYQTRIEHMPQKHQQYQEWSSERIVQWAAKIGENSTAVVKSILKLAKVEQQGYKSCLILLKLADKYSPSSLELACQKALAFNPRPDYRLVQSILKSGLGVGSAEDDHETQDDNPDYSLIRGSEYYKRCSK